MPPRPRPRPWIRLQPALLVTVGLAMVATTAGCKREPQGGKPGALRWSQVAAPTAVPTGVERPVLAPGPIGLDRTTDFSGMGRDEIASLRVARVGEHLELGLFPPGYDPFAPPHSQVYGQIDGSKGWLRAVPMYVTNPYMLATLTCAGRVTPVQWMCRGSEVFVGSRHGREVYRGDAARRVLAAIFECPDDPGTSRVVTVNAWDAGLRWAHVDPARSANVERSDDPRNITRNAHSKRCLYHVGRYGVNNLSPADPQGRIRLTSRDAPTTVLISLWREQPRSPQDEPDFTWEIVVIPD